jgi:hypothetical protein
MEAPVLTTCLYLSMLLQAYFSLLSRLLLIILQHTTLLALIIRKIEREVQWLAFMLGIRETRVQISMRDQGVSWFTSMLENSGTEDLTFGHDRFLPHLLHLCHQLTL